MAPSKRDGTGSSRLGVAHHGQGSVFGSMLGLGRTAARIFDSVLRLTLTGLPAAMQLGNWAHMGNIAGMDRTSTKW